VEAFMPREELAGDGFERRRRKEELAFLVVKFLRAYLRFQEIGEMFREVSRSNGLAGSGLFERVRDLEEGLAFDIKEKAHFLFRTGAPAPGLRSDGLAIDARLIDSHIGTGFHLLLILRESLYQIDRYAPEIDQEGETGRRMHAETEELAGRMVERCSELFRSAAEALRRLVTGVEDNEILVLNLLQNIDLLEQVYGAGSAEAIFAEQCRGKRLAGKTGTEKAISYAKAKCGNLTGLPAQSA
jgi:hypothetical protein